MARPYRLQAENCCYHITSRGDDRRAIFRKERDYEKFLEYVVKGKQRYRFYLYAYALMTNHYHLLIETQEANLSKIMQYINTSYTTYHNVKYKRVGHLFQGRYKSIVVDKDSYFLGLSRYIHLNPVKAKMVKNAEDYKWTSYKEYLSLKGKSEYIDKEKVQELGIDLGNKYKEYVKEGIGKEEEIFKNTYAGFILGREDFIKARLDELKEQVENKEEIAYKKHIIREADYNKILELVSKKYNKSKEEITDKRRRRYNREKKIVIYLLRKLTGKSNKEIGIILGMKYSAVSKSGISIEKQVEEDKKLRDEVKFLISNFEV